MNWFKDASNNLFSKKIKEVLKRHTFTQSILDYYHVPAEDIDSHLEIEVCDLNGKFAEGNGKVIRIDQKLLDDSFFKDNFHFVIHEFFHWVKRRNEEKFYFNDPEEIQSFVLQMTWDLISGKNKDEVIKNMYPIIQGHYKDKEKAKSIFKEMIHKAVNLYEIYENGGEFSI
jgi:hypothetical protein